jgi:hypothetical protein
MSFTAGLGCLRSPVGPPDMTINVRSPDRIPERSPGRISGGPEIRSDGVAIAVDVQFNERGVESPHQSNNEDDDDEEEDDDDGTPSNMLSYDPVLGVFNLSHAIEEARDEGDGGNSDLEGDEVLLHDEARLEVEQDLQETQDDNKTLEDKDSKSIIVNTSGKAGAQIPQLPLGDNSPPWGDNAVCM